MKTRLLGIFIMAAIFLLAYWPMEYQLQCRNRAWDLLYNCTLTSKYLNYPIRNYHFNRVIEAGYKQTTQTRTGLASKGIVIGGQSERFRVYLKVNLGELFFLNIYPNNLNSTSLVVSNLNHFIHRGTDLNYEVIQAPKSLEQILAELVTKFLFIASVLMILFGEKTSKY